MGKGKTMGFSRRYAMAAGRVELRKGGKTREEADEIISGKKKHPWYQFDEDFIKSTAACVLDKHLETIDSDVISEHERYELKMRAIDESHIDDKMKEKYKNGLMNIA